MTPDEAWAREKARRLLETAVDAISIPGVGPPSIDVEMSGSQVDHLMSELLFIASTCLLQFHRDGHDVANLLDRIEQRSGRGYGHPPELVG